MYKILIVEDDMVIAKVIANHLAKWNYEVKYITDFRDVIDGFTEFDPQLVLLDVSFQGQVSLLEQKGVVLNLNDTYVTYKGKKIELTKNDFKIMQILMENSGEIVPRNKIMTRLWESDSFIDDNTLTVNVARLRRKLEDIGIYDFITTKKGLGYLVD